MTGVEQVFLDALEDLRDGREQPVERYLERVPSTEREELAVLLAAYFASREQPTDARADAALFERTLAAVDRVAAEESGPAGVLPGLLVELSRTRGLRRSEIVAALQGLLKVPEAARAYLAELYHGLESGQVPGDGLQPPLIEALGQIFRLPVEEVDVARRPLGPPRRVEPAVAFGRGGRIGPASAVDAPAPPRSENEREVFRLFYGSNGG
jgi:hypothetical protein